MMVSRTREQRIERVGQCRTVFLDETTGIHATLDGMLWEYATFHTAVKIVHLAEKRDDEGHPVNKMIFNMVADGYWSRLLFGVRKLLDRAGLTGAKGIYSATVRS